MAEAARLRSLPWNLDGTADVIDALAARLSELESSVARFEERASGLQDTLAAKDEALSWAIGYIEYRGGIEVDDREADTDATMLAKARAALALNEQNSET
jgi:hypothetical protein